MPETRIGISDAPKARPVSGRDVFVYFDNDVKVFAPFYAMDLARRLGIRRDYEQITRDSILSGRPKSARDNRGAAWPRRAIA